MNIGEGISGAYFSEDHRYRFALHRIWDRSLPAMMFTGINPSTADELMNDRTITRVVGFARDNGFGGLFTSNLHPYITPYPKELWKHCTECLVENDEAIRQMVGMTALHLVGWGNDGARCRSRVAEVLKILGQPVHCLKVNPNGEPGHPLYLAKTTPLVIYRRGV